MSIKKTSLFLASLFLALLLVPAAHAEAAFPYQAGAIVTDGDGIEYQVLWISEGKRTVLIYHYPDVRKKTVTLPSTTDAGGVEWMVGGILSEAFKDCTTPDTFVINPDFYTDKTGSLANRWAYISPDAFINGKAQTIKVNPADGNWDTLYPILEYFGPKPTFPAGGIKTAIPGYSDFKNTVNSEDTLYVTVPKGKYTLSSSQDPDSGRELRVYSNTTLYLKGVTFKRNNTQKALASHMLSLGTTGLTMSDGSVNAGGYNGGSNIKIYYGTFDNGTIAGANNICRGSHLQNITIKGTTFKYKPSKALTAGMTNSHCIELAGCKKVTIQNCKFYNNDKCFFDNEAVQIESCSSDETAMAHTNIAAPLDNTQTSNITIKGCTFEGFNYGCGSNHLGPNDQYKTMKFIDNTFIGCKKYCICLYNYNKVTITGNRMKDCNELILNPKEHASKKITQKDNTVIE